MSFRATAKHGERYPLVATRTLDGESTGRITIELVAVDDRQSREGEAHGNRRSREAHLADCVFWGKVKPRNKVPFGSLAEGLANGYDEVIDDVETDPSLRIEVRKLRSVQGTTARSCVRSRTGIPSRH